MLSVTKGVNRMKQPEQKEKKCNCDSLKILADDYNIPIVFDKKEQQYILIGKKLSKMYFYYCPICGGHLPQSKIEDSFYTPSEKEIDLIINKIKDSKNISSIVKIFGNPDKEFVYSDENKTKGDEARNKVFGLGNTTRTLLYKTVGKTLDLFIDEDEEGKIIYYFSGKPKETN
jgi:hypothetical protein